MEDFIISIIICITLPLLFSLIYRLKEREEKKEKKLRNDNIFYVKHSKTFLIIFLSFMIMLFVGMVVIAILPIIYDEPNKKAVIIGEIVCAFFFSLSFLGFAISKFDYLIVKENCIIKKQLFKKTSIFSYYDIVYVSSNTFGFGEVTGYDIDGIPLFSVSHFHVGAKELNEMLRNRGSMLLPNPYPSDEMKQNERFKVFKRKTSLKTCIICFLIFGLLFVGMFFLIKMQISYDVFENHKVTGEVEEFLISDNTLKITLKDDNKVYWLNNLAYEKLNKKMYDKLENGTNIVIYVSYVDEYGRSNISQIEIDDVIYLDMQSVERKEHNNYYASNITSYVMLGIGILFIGISFIDFIKLNKMLLKEIRN